MIKTSHKKPTITIVKKDGTVRVAFVLRKDKGIKCNWICPVSCFQELQKLSSLPVRELIYKKKEWNRLLKVASSDEQINQLIIHHPGIKETNSILRLNYPN